MIKTHVPLSSKKRWIFWTLNIFVIALCKYANIEVCWRSTYHHRKRFAVCEWFCNIFRWFIRCMAIEIYGSPWFTMAPKQTLLRWSKRFHYCGTCCVMKKIYYQITFSHQEQRLGILNSKPKHSKLTIKPVFWNFTTFSKPKSITNFFYCRSLLSLSVW